MGSLFNWVHLELRNVFRTILFNFPARRRKNFEAI